MSVHESDMQKFERTILKRLNQESYNNMVHR